MSSPSVVSRATDTTPLRTAVRTALLANATITGIVGQRVYRDLDVTDNAPIYLVVTVPSDIPQNTYSSTGINALVYIQCVCLGYASDADTVKAAVQTVMLDTGFAVAGYDVLDVARVHTLDRSQMQQSKVYFYAGDCYRVRLRKR